jgi:LAGLIDADG DNA endonuclease family protein
LQKVLEFFKVGTIVITGSTASYRVNNMKDLLIIINHFYLYPLLTFKQNIFYIFVIIYNIIKEGKHLTSEGFLLCIAYINLMNNPLDKNKLNNIINKLGLLPKIILPPIIYYNYINIKSPF